MTGETRRLSQIVLMCCNETEIVGQMHSPVGELAASSIGSDLIASGGMNAEGYVTSECHRVYSGFHIARAAPLPTPRYRHSSAADSKGEKVYVVGGVIAIQTAY